MKKLTKIVIFCKNENFMFKTIKIVISTLKTFHQIK